MRQTLERIPRNGKPARRSLFTVMTLLGWGTAALAALARCLMDGDEDASPQIPDRIPCKQGRPPSPKGVDHIRLPGVTQVSLTASYVAQSAHLDDRTR